MQLRPYQQTAVAKLQSALRDGHRQLLYTLPTGGGKTVIFSHIARRAVHRGHRVLVLVHRRELLLQCSRSLDALHVEHSLIQAGIHTAPPDDATPSVTVASIPTLARRLDNYHRASFSLIIVDEAHHVRARTWSKILSHLRDAYLLGVTATPSRLDGKGLGAHVGGHFDILVEGPTTADLTQDGFLCPVRVFAPPGFDATGLHKRAGDYAKNELSDKMAEQGATILGDAISHYRKHVAPAPTLAFCVSVAHAEQVAASYRSAGFRSACLHGKLAERERAQLIDGLGRGHLQVLTSCDIVSEGTDIPVCVGAQLLRPTLSTPLYLQQVGRIRRPGPGKVGVVLDHVGNVARHGHPDERRTWSLDGGCVKPEDEKGPRVAECPRCYAVFQPGAKKCPECGAVIPEKRLEDMVVTTVDGQLVEVTPEQAAALERQRKFLDKLEQRRARTWDDLAAIAKKRGYKPGWVDHMIEARAKKDRARALRRGNRRGEYV